MKKKNSTADRNPSKNKKKPAKKIESGPKNLPPKEKFPLNQDRRYAESSKQNQTSPHKKPYEQQSQGIDQNVNPQHTGSKPDERSDVVEAKRRNLSWQSECKSLVDLTTL